MPKPNGPDAKAAEQLRATVMQFALYHLKTHDPRLVLQVLLENAALLANRIMKGGKANPSQIAMVFSQTLVDALDEESPDADAPPPGPQIEIVGADTPFSKKRG